MLSRRQQSAVNPPTRRPNTQPGPSPAPQAPRAMAQRGPQVLDARLEKIQQDEAEKLYPRLLLFEALAGFKDKIKQRKPSEDPVCEARRNFLDSFAYLCDTRKGGATVTATGLQQLQISDFLWLAANEGISDDVLEYAKEVLANLKTVNTENQNELKDRILKMVVQKCTPRIQFYKNEVRWFARGCRMKLRSKESDDNGVKYPMTTIEGCLLT
jgi:hypothetical protein